MRLWIDGGALHATVRCLQQTARPSDAAEQLHLATQLAFADRLLIGAYGGGDYSRETENARKTLATLGFEADCIQIENGTQEELERVYVQAGDSLARRLQEISSAVELGEPYPTFSGDRQSLEDRFDVVIRQNLTDCERADLFEEVRSAENNGLLVMLTRSDAFWEAVRRLVSDGSNWSPSDSARLATLCRIYIHQAYARLRNAVYAPGRDRGKTLRKIPEYVFQHIQELPGKAIDGFKVGETGLPPVAAVLAQRAKGDPKGLMEETLRIRALAKPLREHVGRVLDATAKGDGAAQLHARRKMEQLTADLKVHLRVGPAASIGSALDIFNAAGFIWTLVSSGTVAGGGKMVSVLMSLLRSRRIAVLSEMAAEIEVAGIDPGALAALERGVSARRSS